MRVALITLILSLFLSGCAALESVTRHELHSGYFTIKNPDDVPRRVYAEVLDDSVGIYDVMDDIPLNGTVRGGPVSNFSKENFLNGITLEKRSFDVDLATVITKLRPAQISMAPQLNSNINAAMYGGFRKDFFHFRTKSTILGKTVSSVRHLGYDAGIFAGIGITAMNPWVTNNNISVEYDGVVFQKGVAFFITSGSFSAGVALGSDNLTDRNSGYWIYNNKLWIGIMIGIANF